MCNAITNRKNNGETMKKPNITEGEWSVGYFETTVVSDQNDNLTIKGSYRDEDKEYYGGYLIAESVSPNNAKAISAVPELIDALIESTKLLESLKEIETESELINEIEQQLSMNKYSALKKAGVEL